jgi:trans-aconitate methyltransferase
VSGLLYREPRLYRGLLRLLYGGALRERERLVAALVPPGASVVDACCGDAGIARRLPGSRYLGLDVSPGVVRALRRRGVDACETDLAREDPPRADVVLLLGSLYQFLPDEDAFLLRLRRAARRVVVVAEPYRNVASHRLPWVAAAARRATRTRSGGGADRFSEPALRALLERHGATAVARTSRELVAALPGCA